MYKIWCANNEVAGEGAEWQDANILAQVVSWTGLWSQYPSDTSEELNSSHRRVFNNYQPYDNIFGILVQEKNLLLLIIDTKLNWMKNKSALILIRYYISYFGNLLQNSSIFQKLIFMKVFKCSVIRWIVEFTKILICTSPWCWVCPSVHLQMCCCCVAWELFQNSYHNGIRESLRNICRHRCRPVVCSFLQRCNQQ